MNRYHLGLIFSAIAILLISTFFIKQNQTLKQIEAEQQTEQVLEFATNCVIKGLQDTYGSVNDGQKISKLFFNSIALMEAEQSIVEGRITAEDFYPYVPVMLYIEERYYFIGSFNGSTYEWSEAIYYPGKETLGETNKDTLLDDIEHAINTRLKEYHTVRNMEGPEYLLPDYTVRNLQPATVLIVLENFPTILNQYYYSGVYGSSGTLERVSP